LAEHQRNSTAGAIGVPPEVESIQVQGKGMETQVFRNAKLPSLYLYAEYLSETISGFSHPAFDQKRIFIGICQPVTPTFKINLGCMNIFASGGAPAEMEYPDVLRPPVSWSPDPFRKRDSTKATGKRRADLPSSKAALSYYLKMSPTCCPHLAIYTN
jgi:hypothetical protein